MTPAEPEWQTWRDRSWKHRVAYDLAAMAAFAVMFGLLFILGDLIIYGTVRW